MYLVINFYYGRVGGQAGGQAEGVGGQAGGQANGLENWRIRLSAQLSWSWG